MNEPRAPVPPVVILAAGTGSRLLPLTADRPKCMVDLHGRPLLAWQRAACARAGLDRVILVGGHGAATLPLDDGLELVDNPRYATTNMVESLWCARAHLTGGVVVVYGDIVFEPRLVSALLSVRDGPAVVVDTDWLPYWRERFDDPLSDAESLKVDTAGRIASIGQKEASLEAIQAQYIGLFRLDAAALEVADRIRSGALAPDPVTGWTPPPRPRGKWFMTDLLHALVHCGVALEAVQVAGGWLEIDSHRDLAVATARSRPAGDALAIRT